MIQRSREAVEAALAGIVTAHTGRAFFLWVYSEASTIDAGFSPRKSGINRTYPIHSNRENALVPWLRAKVPRVVVKMGLPICHFEA